MKKRLTTFLFVAALAFSFAIPVMTSETVVSEPVNTVAEQEISPLHEFTRAYFRTYHGQLQMRIWSITNGRWITDWIDI